MAGSGPSGPSGDGATLTTGDLAERTGVAPATLRMWEQRHGFPVPTRAGGGHRRYAEADVAAVHEVLARRARGVHLEAAIEQVVAAHALREGPASVFAEIRRRHPHVRTHRLRKPTLIGLSHAMEDELRAGAERALLFGSFQRAEFWRPARTRWTELARVSAGAFVLGHFPPEDLVADDGGPAVIGLDADSPLRSEWAVVVDAPGLAMVLSAWELPGDEALPERDRAFEAVWSVSPVVVRDAARVCAEVARRAEAPGAERAVEMLADDPTDAAPDVDAMTALFGRVVSYVDDSAAPWRPRPGRDAQRNA